MWKRRGKWPPPSGYRWQQVAFVPDRVIAGHLVFSFFTIARPMRALTVAMEDLAGGNFAVVLPGLGRKDEVGGVAGAVEKFKVVSEQRPATKPRPRSSRSGSTRRSAKPQWSSSPDEFEGAVRRDRRDRVVLAIVRVGSFRRCADQDGRTGAGNYHDGGSGVEEEASTNVQSVASATEELSSSVNEISRQVQESAQMASAAVDQARQTNDRVGELAKAASRIGDVVKLINTIAGQTNLLALNATIEAARAGEAAAAASPRSCAFPEVKSAGGADRGESHRRDRPADHRHPGRDPGLGERDQGDQRHHRQIVGNLLDHCRRGGRAGRRHPGNLAQRAAGRRRDGASLHATSSTCNVAPVRTGSASSQSTFGPRGRCHVTQQPPQASEVGKFLNSVRAALTTAQNTTSPPGRRKLGGGRSDAAHSADYIAAHPNNPRYHFGPSRGHRVARRRHSPSGSRRHFIPASLSLTPLCGCLLNRSRDCDRSRVPPRFPRRRYADAPAAASFTALRPGAFRRFPARPLCRLRWLVI